MHRCSCTQQGVNLLRGVRPPKGWSGTFGGGSSVLEEDDEGTHCPRLRRGGGGSLGGEESGLKEEVGGPHGPGPREGGGALWLKGKMPRTGLPTRLRDLVSSGYLQAPWLYY